jgi:hypothetical protein
MKKRLPYHYARIFLGCEEYENMSITYKITVSLRHFKQRVSPACNVQFKAITYFTCLPFLVFHSISALQILLSSFKSQIYWISLIMIIATKFKNNITVFILPSHGVIKCWFFFSKCGHTVSLRDSTGVNHAFIAKRIYMAFSLSDVYSSAWCLFCKLNIRAKRI